MDRPPLFDDEEWQRLVDSLSLTPRQAEVVALLLRGDSERQIAAKIGISPPTVRTHLQRVFAALEVPDRTMLVVEIFRRFRERTRKCRHCCHIVQFV